MRSPTPPLRSASECGLRLSPQARAPSDTDRNQFPHPCPVPPISIPFDTPQRLRRLHCFGLQVGPETCTALAMSAPGLEEASLLYCHGPSHRGLGQLLSRPGLRHLEVHSMEGVVVHASRGQRWPSTTPAPSPWWIGGSAMQA